MLLVGYYSDRKWLSFVLFLLDRRRRLWPCFINVQGVTADEAVMWTADQSIIAFPVRRRSASDSDCSQRVPVA